MAIGLAYGILEHFVDLETIQSPKIFLVLDDLVVFCLPVALGALAGLVYNYMHRQGRINRALSTDSAKRRHDVLTQLLGSHLLHEIGNPLHNLTVGIERWQHHMPAEQTAMLQRNIDRLQAVTRQLRNWHTLDDTIDLHEPVPLRPWLQEFVHDKVRSELNRADVACELDLDALSVRMHSVLLEQCFVTVFNNALTAVMSEPSDRAIRIAAHAGADRPGFARVTLRNTGALFPSDVLSKQGREPVHSQQGLGLGLVLVQRTLEHVGGALQLANDDGWAVTTLWIPTEAA